MHPALRSARRLTADERGVALPLALLGLISVSLLVTTALVTSSTELAISSAHQDATADLYVAEGGLQAYVAANGTALMNDAGTTVTFQPPSGGVGEAVDVSVLFLGQQVLAGSQGTLRLFSVSATPSAAGGRMVSTLVRQVVPVALPLTTNITSALTLGGNLDVDGNAFTVSGRSSTCGSTGVEAARIATDSEVDANSTRHMSNFIGTDDAGQQVEGWDAIERTGLSRDELAMDVLGGVSLSALITQVPATHRWGPEYPLNGEVRSWDGVLDTVPQVAVDERVAVVDAAGGTIEIRGGRGLLIVVNGNIEMQGRSRFDGIIITEGSFWLHGTPHVNGALISLARDVENRIDLNEEAEIDGHVTIQYDKCIVDAARQAFSDVTANPVPTVQETSAWLERSR